MREAAKQLCVSIIIDFYPECQMIPAARFRLSHSQRRAGCGCREPQDKIAAQDIPERGSAAPHSSRLQPPAADRDGRTIGCFTRAVVKNCSWRAGKLMVAMA
jgi:hypothetical protein